MTTPASAPYPRLVGDIGGTGCRFGWVARAGDISHIASVDGGASLETAIDLYLAQQGPTRPAAVALAVAAPVLGDEVTMTNRAWAFSVRDLAKRFRVDRVLVLNDFEALAHGLQTLREGDSWPVGAGRSVAGAPLAVIGPGTGLGVSGLVPSPGGGFAVVTGEGGHVSLATATAREDDVLRVLRRRFGHVSAERVLSGAGIVNLHDAVHELEGRTPPVLTAAQVTTHALAGDDPACAEAMALFFAILGSAAGDLALTFGARGGVFIAGGIVGRLGEVIRSSTFRDRFEAKGRYRSYLAAIPTAVVGEPATLALRGANAALGI